MLRSSLSRRTVAGGAAVAALVGAALATTGTAGAAPAASPHLLASPHFDAPDTNFTFVRSSPIIAGTSGTFAWIQIANPSTSLTLNVDNDFLVYGLNSAGAVIASATPANGMLSELDNNVPAGQTGIVQARFTVPGVTSVQVANASGYLSNDLGQRLPVQNTSTKAPSGGYEEVDGTVANPTGFAETGKVIILAEDAANHLVDVDYTYVNNVPAGGSAAFSALETPANHYEFLADALTFESPAYAQVGTSAAVKGAVYQGSTVQLYPTLTLGGKPLAGKTIQAVTHALGQPTTVIGSGVTDGTGTADIKATLPGPVQLFFQYLGDATTIGSTSGDLHYTGSSAHLTFSGANKVSINGKKVKPSDKPGVKPKTVVAFTGNYVNLGKSEKIELQEYINKHWRKVGQTTNLKGTGTFTIHFKASSKKGTYKFRLHVGQNLYHGDLVSHLQYTLRVR